MSILNLTKLHGIRVETKLGDYVGRFKDLELDLDTFKITAIIVSPAGLIKKLVGEDLYVSLNHVVEINQEKIIIDDAVIKNKGAKIESQDYQAPVKSNTNPVVTSKN